MKKLCQPQKSCKTSTDKKIHSSRKMKQHLRMGNSKRVQIMPAFWGQKCLEKGICPYSTKLQYRLIFITDIL